MHKKIAPSFHLVRASYAGTSLIFLHLEYFFISFYLVKPPIDLHVNCFFILSAVSLKLLTRQITREQLKARIT